MSKSVMLVLGTRPEAIKFFPIHKALASSKIKTILCGTFQHKELLSEALEIFGLNPDINLNVMKSNQDLFYLTQIILEKMKAVYQEYQPSVVLVQGDTTTAYAAALAAFYMHIPVGHIEAGLRSGDIQSPFPEEMNRCFITKIADYHFAPTALNVANLLSEGVDRKKIFCIGNTVVDAMQWMKKQIELDKICVPQKIVDVVESCKSKRQKLVLLTTHRRESFGDGLIRVFKAVKKFLEERKDVFVFFPMHPNPAVARAFNDVGLASLKNIFVSDPISYPSLIKIMMSADWVVTDSGGIQEEAISLGKPVMVLRDVTERVEGVWEGAAVLVGTDQDLIYSEMYRFYEGGFMISGSRVYGDGRAAEKIVSVLKTVLQTNYEPDTLQSLKALCGRVKNIGLVD